MSKYAADIIGWRGGAVRGKRRHKEPPLRRSVLLCYLYCQCLKHNCVLWLCQIVECVVSKWFVATLVCILHVLECLIGKYLGGC